MGLGICAMHYTGMAAMEMSPPIHYDPALFAASVVIAIAAALAALWIAFTLRGDHVDPVREAGSAVVMGLAITGMHYTGMAAAQFAPDTICLTGPLVDNSWMAGTIAGVTFLILCVTLVLSVLDARMPRETAKMAVVAAAGERRAAAPGAARRPDQAAQPHAARGPHRAGDRAQQARRSTAVRGAVRRPRPLQDGQRLARPLVGDEVLKAIAERLRAAVRGRKTRCRVWAATSSSSC